MILESVDVDRTGWNTMVDDISSSTATINDLVNHAKGYKVRINDEFKKG